MVSSICEVGDEQRICLCPASGRQRSGAHIVWAHGAATRRSWKLTALANIGLDLLGQARNFLTYAAEREGKGDEDTRLWPR